MRPREPRTSWADQHGVVTAVDLRDGGFLQEGAYPDVAGRLVDRRRGDKASGPAVKELVENPLDHVNLSRRARGGVHA